MPRTTVICAALVATALSGAPAMSDQVLEQARHITSLQASWDAFSAGDYDALAEFYAEDMIFILPGQADVLEGRDAFRAALDGIGDALPPGFEVTEMRYLAGASEVANVVKWTADNVPEGSQTMILFRFDDEGLIEEERWFIDTEQWAAAF